MNRPYEKIPIRARKSTIVALIHIIRIYDWYQKEQEKYLTSKLVASATSCESFFFFLVRVVDKDFLFSSIFT